MVHIYQAVTRAWVVRRLPTSKWCLMGQHRLVNMGLCVARQIKSEVLKSCRPQQVRFSGYPSFSTGTD
ncbi:hypothetical protein FKM82_007934 [Ascaphus truei]